LAGVWPTCDDRNMERRKRAAKAGSVDHGAGRVCAVCGTSDARLLVMVELPSGEGATLCGSHALLHSRMNEPCRTVAELRTMLSDRRTMERRATGEGDELAERLTAAFTRERRGNERRAS
jgi:hypothetical protein